MYSTVSENFKNECKQDVNQYKRIAKIHVVEDNIDITNDNALVDFTIEETAYSENTFIGNSVAKKLDLNIINDGTYNLENKEVEVYVGIDYEGDGSNTELVPYGNFIISKPTNEEVKNASNYVGYDYMIKTETPYVEDNIVYPMSLYNYLSAICTTLGLTLGNVSIPNGNYQVLGNAYTNGENFRQVIEEIATCCGGFAVIGRDNKLYIRTLVHINDNEDDEITPGEYFEDFGTNNEYGPINRVAIALTYNVIGEDTIREDGNSIVRDGLTAIRVSDISFLNSEAQRELIIDNFWTQLHNLKYVPFSAEYYGYPYLDSGDIIKIKLPNNSYAYSYVFNHKFTYNGAFSGKIETPALSDVEKEYDYSPTAKSTLRNTELRVDKINGQITSIINEIGDRSDKQTSITQDIDSIELTVNDLEDLTLETQGFNPIQLDNCMAGELIGLRIFGNNTVFSNLMPDNELYPSDNLIPRGDSVLKIYTDNKCPTSNNAWEKKYYNLMNDIILVRDKNRFVGRTYFAGPPAYYKGSLAYHEGYWFLYIECKPNTTYELLIPEEYSTFMMSIASFKENLFTLIDQSNQNIYTDNYDSNMQRIDGRWVYDGTKKKYVVTTGNNDKYLCVKYDVPGFNMTLNELGSNRFSAISQEIKIDKSQTMYFSLKGYSYYYLTDVLYYDENEEYLGNYEDIYEGTISTREFELVYPNDAFYCKFVVQKLDEEDNPVVDTENFEMNNVKPMLATSLSTSFVEYNSYEVDLGITEPLRQHSNTVYDEVVYDANYLYDLGEDVEEDKIDKCMLIRRVGIDSYGQTYELAQPIYQAINIPSIMLVAGINYIDISSGYTANMYAKWVQINDFTKVFATQYNVTSQITQLANAISLLVTEKVGNEEIVAKINLAVENEQGIIEIKGNQIEIKSDYFTLSKNGEITATRGNIAGWNITNSRLYKYRSGMIANTSDIGRVFYAGADIDTTDNPKFYVLNDGQVTAQLLHIECQSTTGGLDGIHCYYNKKLGMVYHPWGMQFIDTDDTTGDFTLASLSRNTESQYKRIGLWLDRAVGFIICDKTNDNTTLYSFNKDNAIFYKDLLLSQRGYMASGSGAYALLATTTSDRRLKKEISDTEIKNALDLIREIHHRSFTWKHDGVHKKIGYIAQELENIEPDFVEKVEQPKDIETEYEYIYQLDTLSILATATKAIQELDEENKKLKEKLEDLEKRLSKLEGGK